MRRISRPLVIVALALLVPIVPFVLGGDRLESWAAAWVDHEQSPWLLAGMTTALLASDILLPVPSSLVSTLAGTELGLVSAALASWIGLTAGGVAGFALARACGRPLVRRLSAPGDLAAIDRTGRQLGVWLLAATRPLPVLAEATVLLLGTSDMSWRTFLPVLAIGNLAVATAYSALGSFAWRQSAAAAGPGRIGRSTRRGNRPGTLAVDTARVARRPTPRSPSATTRHNHRYARESDPFRPPGANARTMPDASLLDELLAGDPALYQVTTAAAGPAGALPLTDEMLRNLPSGDLFGLSQNAGMGWPPAEMVGPEFLILSTQGGVRAADGTPIALGCTPAIGKWDCWSRLRPAS